jgi:hypothetical protein
MKLTKKLKKNENLKIYNLYIAGGASNMQDLVRYSNLKGD